MNMCRCIMQRRFLFSWMGILSFGQYGDSLNPHLNWDMPLGLFTPFAAFLHAVSGQSLYRKAFAKNLKNRHETKPSKRQICAVTQGRPPYLES